MREPDFISMILMLPNNEARFQGEDAALPANA